MANKKDAWTESDGCRHYKCRSCGKDVIMPRWKWTRLRTDQKRLCAGCAEIRNRPTEQTHYAPYGPYNFGFM